MVVHWEGHYDSTTDNQHNDYIIEVNGKALIAMGPIGKATPFSNSSLKLSIKMSIL
jgi:hypothetical protein